MTIEYRGEILAHCEDCNREADIALCDSDYQRRIEKEYDDGRSDGLSEKE